MSAADQETQTPSCGDRARRSERAGCAALTIEGACDRDIDVVESDTMVEHLGTKPISCTRAELVCPTFLLVATDGRVPTFVNCAWSGSSMVMIGRASRLPKSGILEYGRRSASWMFVVLLCLPLLAFVRASAAASATESLSLTAWDNIVQVLRHPRCLNCHQLERPLQGDSRRIHIPPVVRGSDNLGAGTMRCYNCHNDRNNEMARVPGAPKWSLAPSSMNWEGKSDAELCELLKTPELYHDRFPDALLQHVAEEHLVLWGWKPDSGRSAIQLDHAEFVNLVKAWVEGGLACPKS